MGSLLWLGEFSGTKENNSAGACHWALWVCGTEARPVGLLPQFCHCPPPLACESGLVGCCGRGGRGEEPQPQEVGAAQIMRPSYDLEAGSVEQQLHASTWCSVMLVTARLRIGL